LRWLFGKLKEAFIRAIYACLSGRPLITLSSLELEKRNAYEAPVQVADGVWMRSYMYDATPTRRLSIYVLGTLENLTAPEEQLPTVYYVPGGCWYFTNLSLRFRVHLMPLARSGKFLVAVIGHRLSSEGNIDGVLADGVKAYDQLLLVPGVDPDRITLWGHSSGGGLTGWLATVRPANLLILWAAALDPRLVSFWKWQSALSYWFTKRIHRCRPSQAPATTHMLGQMSLNPACLINFPRTHLVHGTADFAVHPEQSFLAHRELVDKGVRAELRLIPGGGHGIASREGGRYVQEAYELISAVSGVQVDFSATKEELQLLHRNRAYEAISF